MKLFDKERREERFTKIKTGFQNNFNKTKDKSKEVYGTVKVYGEKGAVVAKKSATYILFRTIFSILTPIILAGISVVLFFRGFYISSFFVWIFLPIAWFVMFGDYKSRIVNILPLVAVILYIMVGLEIHDFNEATYVFFFVPFISLLVKFKKHYIQYITLGISIVYLIVNYLQIYEVPFYAKWGLIVIIYVIFIPPMIGRKLHKIFYGKKYNESDVEE
jgi:hypothetical protein